MNKKDFKVFSPGDRIGYSFKLLKSLGVSTSSFQYNRKGTIKEIKSKGFFVYAIVKWDDLNVTEKHSTNDLRLLRDKNEIEK